MRPVADPKSAPVRVAGADGHRQIEHRLTGGVTADLELERLGVVAAGRADALGTALCTVRRVQAMPRVRQGFSVAIDDVRVDDEVVRGSCPASGRGRDG